MRAVCARFLLYLVAALAVAFGLRYATATALMPYHQAFIDLPAGALPPKVLALLLANYRVIGSSFLALGLIIAVLAEPVSKRERRAWLATACILVLLVPLLLVVLQQGTTAPWWAAAAAILLVTAALGLARPRVG